MGRYVARARPTTNPFFTPKLGISFPDHPISASNYWVVRKLKMVWVSAGKKLKKRKRKRKRKRKEKKSEATLRYAQHFVLGSSELPHLIKNYYDLHQRNIGMSLCCVGSYVGGLIIWLHSRQ